MATFVGKNHKIYLSTTGKGGQKTDSDVSSFLSRTGITDSTHIEAVIALVQGLKLANLWRRGVGVYPMIGGTSTTHAQNLVSSSYPLNWQNDGGLIHNWQGVLGDKIGQAYTLLKSSYLGVNPVLAAYIVGVGATTNSSESYLGGGFNTTSLSLGRGSNGTDTLALGEGTFWNAVSAVDATDGTGFFSGSRYTSTDSRLYHNGIQIANSTLEADFTESSTRNCYVLAKYNNLQTDNLVSFCFFGKNFTSINDHINLYNIVQRYHTILGRQIE